MDIENSIPRRQVLTVSELTSLIKATLEGNFPSIWVEGEIFNFRIPSSGHAYFTLKDNNSQIKAVLFRSSGRTLRFVPKDGLHVICRGRVSLYEFRGEYQIIVDYMEPRGIGALLMAFEQLKEKLSAEGLFDEARKRPIPVFPQKIGIVTSPTGAAVRDILKVIDRRFANVRIVISPASVQGEKAAPEIVQAISDLNEMEDVDVIIVARGGGGIEDLWPFNEEVVARAIYNSRIPVVSAVGHEIDYTIADFVADLRAPTPSAAAELVVRNKEDVENQINALFSRLAYALRKFFEIRRERLASLMQRVLSPDREIMRYVQRMDDLEDRLVRSMLRMVSDRRRHFQMQVARLNSLSPLAILSRGYSITFKLPSGTVVKSSDDVREGDKIDVMLHEGRIICTVEETS